MKNDHRLYLFLTHLVCKPESFVSKTHPAVLHQTDAKSDFKAILKRYKNGRQR